MNDPDSTVLYQQIHHGFTGSDANAVFNQWAIQEVYAGCGGFLKYGITADPSDSTALSILEYPQPGYS